MTELKLHPAGSALLIVDVQEKLARTMPQERGDRCVRRITWLLEAARRLDVPVAVTEQYPKGLGPTVGPIREALDAFEAPPPVVEKVEFDACQAAAFGTSAARSLAGRTVVVAGQEAHICVFQTVRGLRERGYDVHVPGDATCSRSADDQRIAEGLWARSGAVVTCTEAVLFDWMGKAGGETFKAIQALLKEEPTPALDRA